MKANRIIALALLGLSTFNAQLSTLLAQGTAFSYQGRLNDGTGPANGSYDFAFSVWSAATGPAQVGGTFTTNGVAVSNGLFTVTIDFGPGIFTGEGRWLQIAVRTNGAPTFVTLTPREKVTAVPYAMTAGNITGAVSSSSIVGTYSSAITFSNTANRFIGSFTGNGSALSNVNALTLGGLPPSSYWTLAGNSVAPGQFLGSTNNQPVEIRVNSQRALRLEANMNNAPNVILGSPLNLVGLGGRGSTIGGGGADNPNAVLGSFGAVAGGVGNVAHGFAAVSGGDFNLATGESAAIGGGGQNNARGRYATIGGGNGNFIDQNSGSATIAGGLQNIIASNSPAATVGGGRANQAYNDSSTVPGGAFNSAIRNYSFAAGFRAKAYHQGSLVWADSQNSDFESTANDQFNVRAAGGVRLSDSTPSVSFGATTRQMLNLWGTNYGIGVQNSSLYFRCNNGSVNDGFIWYKGGGHANGYADPGGGAELMHLVSSGLYVNGALVSSSDRNSKTNFAPVDTREVLNKVVALPLSRWSYKKTRTPRTSVPWHRISMPPSMLAPGTNTSPRSTLTASPWLPSRASIRNWRPSSRNGTSRFVNSVRPLVN